MWAAKRIQAAEYASANNQFPMWAAFGIGVWGIACLSGFLFLFDYSTRPSDVASGNAGNWPASSALERNDNRKQLVVFLHPKCPCSRATVRELERMGDLLKQPVLSFVFFKPEHEPDAWVQTNLWRSAQAFSNANISIDVNAAESKQFGAQTSGCVMLFNSRGKRVFFGGITSGRGHEGDTDAKQTLAQLIKAEFPEQELPAEYPVFGCPIQSSASRAGTSSAAPEKTLARLFENGANEKAIRSRTACSQCQLKGQLDE